MKCFELWSVSLCRMARDTRPGFLRVGIRYRTSSYDRTWPLSATAVIHGSSRAPPCEGR